MRLVKRHQHKRQSGSGNGPLRGINRWFFLLGGFVLFLVGTWSVLQILDRPSHSESSPQSASKATPATPTTLPAPSDSETFTFYKTLQAPAHAKPEPPGLKPKTPVVLQGRTAGPAHDPSAQVQKTRPKGYAIQVAAFRDRPAANNLIHQLKKKKYPAYLLTVRTGGQETWYRVRVGPFAKRAQAEDVARRLKVKERLGSYIARSTEPN